MRDIPKELAKRLAAEGGLDVGSPGRSQGYASLTYGYARVEVLHGGYGDERIRARGRKEGSGVPRGEVPIKGEFETEDELYEWALDILRTGRTVEVGKGAGLPDRFELWPVFNPCDFHPESLVEEIEGRRTVGTERPPWDLNPDYQRGRVWTDEQAEAFMGHLCEHGQVPLIFVQRYDRQKNAPEGTDYLDLPVEVIDGQQRCRAIQRFVNGEIAAELTDGRRLWFKDFNEIERRMLPNVKIAYVDIDRRTKLRFYLRLNRGGTVHTEAEIAKVRELLAAEEGNG